MKKTMMMAAILLAATLTGCGSASRKVAPTQTVKQTMPRAAAATVVTATPATTETTKATTTMLSTQCTAQSATTMTQAYAAPATTASTATTSTTAVTTAATTAATTTQTPASRDADFTWFCKGVYEVSTEGNVLGTYYVFNDSRTGRVDTVSGIGIGFNCEQNKNGVLFHMGTEDDSTVLTIDTTMNGTLTGTMYGHTYTFTLLNGVNPDFFDAAYYEMEIAFQTEELYAEEETNEYGKHPGECGYGYRD